ncbi:MAG: DUF1963 domain-containing protein, partial [Maribacter sp.]
MKITVDTSQLNVASEKMNAFINEYQQFKRVLDAHKRIAYLPIVAENKLTFSTDSKIGGIPYLRSTDDWPMCPSCGNHQDLFLQLNLKDVPEQNEEGIVQLFYCTSDNQVCQDNYKPFSKHKTVRNIQVIGEPVKVRPNTDTVFQEKLIVSWQSFYEYPHFEEYARLNIEPVSDGMLDTLHTYELSLPSKKDKLFGWPYWIQGVEYP